MADKLLTIDKSNTKITHFRGSGPGGQHRNKVATCVRVTHKPTGISTTGTEHKSQEQNKRSAIKKFWLKMIEHWMPEKRIKRMHPTRIRSYNEKDGTVKDHRTGLVKNYKRTLNGDLDPFIEAMQKQEGAE